MRNCTNVTIIHCICNFHILNCTINTTSRNSSVGRALDWRYKGPWFKSPESSQRALNFPGFRNSFASAFSIASLYPVKNHTKSIYSIIIMLLLLLITKKADCAIELMYDIPLFMQPLYFNYTAHSTSRNSSIGRALDWKYEGLWCKYPERHICSLEGFCRINLFRLIRHSTIRVLSIMALKWPLHYWK